MKLVRFGAAGHEKPGIVDAQGAIRDLSAHVKDFTGEVLAPASMDKLRKVDPASLPLAPTGVRIGAPVGDVRNFIAVGLNYADHAKESGMPIPKEPILFNKLANCIVGPNDDVMMPRKATKLDWELEIAFVVGKRARYVEEKDAASHIAGYTIANERRSTTRYVADVTFMFNPDAVGRTLRAANIAFARAPSRPILVIPMSPGVSRGPWAQALMAPAFRKSLVPFTVSGAESDAELAGLNFDSAGWGDVSDVASRHRVTEVALVQAIYANGKMTVNIRRLGVGETPAKVSVDVPMVQTVSTTYPAAAQAAVRVIEDLWKTRSAVDFSQRGRMTADVRIASLAQWGDLQSQLAAISSVTGMTVTAMTVGYARINLTYMGGTEQLREAFAGAGLSLNNRGGQWTLARAGQ